MKRIIQLVKDIIGIVDPRRHKYFFGPDQDGLISECGKLIRKVKRFPTNPRILRIKISARITPPSGVNVNERHLATVEPPAELGLSRKEELAWLEDNYEEIIRDA